MGQKHKIRTKEDMSRDQSESMTGTDHRNPRHPATSHQGIADMLRIRIVCTTYI